MVCRELTKTHEEVIRGTLGELAEWAGGGRARRGHRRGGRGAAGRPGPTRPMPRARVAVLERAGTPRKAAIAEVARDLGLRKREVYDAVVRHGTDER